MDRSRVEFKTALGVTLWLGGLLVAMMTGMLSAYLVVTAIYVGSKGYKRLRATAGGSARRLGPGGRGA
jgi:hypothetical protein